MRVIGRAFHWLLHCQGSTRPLGLFRIALVLLLWARFSQELAFWNAVDIEQVAAGLAFFALTPLALIGWQTRRVMTALAILMTLVYFHFGLVQGYAPFTHHHVYLLTICTILCAIGPCERSFSLDRYAALKRKKPAPESGSLLANRLLLLQLTAVYFWAAWDKTNAPFLSGTRLEQIMHFHYSQIEWAQLLLTPEFIVASSVAVVIAEYFLAGAILFRKLLPVALVVGLLLHGVFYVLLPVQTFSLTILSMYIFALPSRTVHETVYLLVQNEAHSKASA